MTNDFFFILKSTCFEEMTNLSFMCVLLIAAEKTEKLYENKTSVGK